MIIFSKSFSVFSQEIILYYLMRMILDLLIRKCFLKINYLLIEECILSKKLNINKNCKKMSD